MKKFEEKVEPIILPKGKFAADDDCCGDCDHGVDYKDGGFFGTDKVLCGIDGKWHKSSDICRFYQ